MSLQNLAQHLQSAGRGDDKVLVHMTPKEVAGLQTLAAAHGGSLTVNPETGLPEAGFLSSLLPTILGAALAPATGGFSLMGSQALGTAALVGGGYALATGSLQKGLMAGLGAYGGAGLGTSLMGAAPAAAANALSATAPMVAPSQALTAAGLQGPATQAAAQAASAAAPAAMGVQGGPVALQPSMVSPNPVTQGVQGGTTALSPQVTPPVVPPSNAISTSGGIGDIPSVFSKIGQGVSQMGLGAQELSNDPEKLKKYLLENKYNLLAAGLAANNLNRPEPPREKRYNVPDYDYNRTYAPSAIAPGSTAERTWFAADGGMPVENMSQQNALLDNQRYPMAFQSTPTYANPAERPVAQNVIYPATDAGVTPYSGIATLAKGGKVDDDGVERYLTGGFLSGRSSALSRIGQTARAAAQTTPAKTITAQTAPAQTAPAQTAPAQQPVQLPSGIAKLAGKLTDVKTDIAGNNYSTLNRNWGTEITNQTKELTTFKNNSAVKNALKGRYGADVQAQVQALIADNEADIADANAARNTALDTFLSSTGRSSNTISSRGVRAVTPEGQTKMYMIDGEFIEKGPDEKYDPFTTKDKLSATRGWGKEKRYIEPEDIQRVFEEVVGRAPTPEEAAAFVGKNMSLDDLAAKANKVPDVREKRSFTADDIQAEAKYYWNREMTPGELAAFTGKNYSTFASLRDALIANKSYLDNLNTLNQEAFVKEKTPAPVFASNLEVADTFDTVLGRRPTDAEFARFSKMTKGDIEKALYGSNEYVRTRLLYTENPENYIGDLNPYKPMGVIDTGATGNVATGNVSTLPAGGGSGFVPGLQTSKVPTEQQLAEFKKQYGEYTPTLGTIAGFGTANTAPITAGGANLTSQNIYQPIYQAVPEYNIKGAMDYRSPVTELGLENLYKQLGQKMPDLRTGLSFTPGQAQVAASPFANTTPGLVTLQSAAVPEKYIPPTPILPGTTTQIPALTPQEQVLLSSAQMLPQNVTGLAEGGYAGGEYNLGDYSDGGRLLKGPGDGVSDSIPASINDRRPARLADGEFVIPARIVSELGNGSTEAGARQLYAMMDRVQKQRKKSVGKGKVAVDSKASKLLPV